jgi:Tfp pilus assembly protein PilF
MKWQTLTVSMVLANAQDKAAEIQRDVEASKRALGQNDLAGAEREYRTILRLDPNNADVNTALGVLRYGSGKLTEAVSSFQSALRLDMAQTKADPLPRAQPS